MPLKRFSWKENDLYSIQLKKDCFIIAQILKSPFAAFYRITSDCDFNESKKEIDLNEEEPLIVTMVLNDIFKFSSSGKIKNKKIIPKDDIELPTLFISKDSHDIKKYNIAYIDPEVGDRGSTVNKVIVYDIDDSSEYYETCEIGGYNTGYEFIRRLLLSLEHNKNIDPLKNLRFQGKDPYPYQTIQEMLDMGVPDYEKEKKALMNKSKYKGQNVKLSNPQAINYSFLRDMYEDDFFPNFLVDKGKKILIDFCLEIEHTKPKDLKSLYLLSHKATNKFNELNLEFEENDSEIETVARDCICVDFESLAKIYGFDADIEELTANRDW